MEYLFFTVIYNKVINPKFVDTDEHLIYVPSVMHSFLKLLPAPVKTCQNDEAHQTSQ